MATPADNLERIADLASEIRDFTYNTSVSIAMVDTGIGELGVKLDTIANNIGGGMASARIENDISTIANLAANQFNMLDLIWDVLDKSWKASNSNFAEVQKLLETMGGTSNKNNKQDKSKFNYNSSVSGMLSSLKGGVLSSSIEASKTIISAVNALKEAIKTGDFTKVIEGVVSAASSLPYAFMAITDWAAKFVAAIDPALIARLGLAMSDLMAVVGKGLRPIIIFSVKIIRKFADALLPVMNAMIPAITMLAKSLMDLAIPVIKIWVQSIYSLIPIITGLAPLFSMLGDILAFLTPAFAAIGVVIGKMLLTTSIVFQSFWMGVKILTIGLLEVVSWLANKIPIVGAKIAAPIEEISGAMAQDLLGDFDDFGKSVKELMNMDVLAPEGQAGGSFGMAAKQASFAGIADLGKNMMQAAFGAGEGDIQNRQLEQQRIAANGINQLVALAQQNQGNQVQQGVRN